MTGPPMRMWVNQPSTLQPHHALHGECVLALHEYGDTYRVYFTRRDVFTGRDIESMQMSRLALSPGWPRKPNVTLPTCNSRGP
jgi:hypothetical protein